VGIDATRLRRIDLAMTEFGIVMEPSPGNTAPLAEKIEQLGFDILLSPDTQNLSPDPIGQHCDSAQGLPTRLPEIPRYSPARSPHFQPKLAAAPYAALDAAIPVWRTLEKATALPHS
jgi:hypothetical protein